MLAFEDFPNFLVRTFACSNFDHSRASRHVLQSPNDSEEEKNQYLIWRESCCRRSRRRSSNSWYFWKRITQSRGGRERIGNILVIVVVIKIVAVVVVVVVIAIEDILFRFRYFFLLKMPLKIVEEKVSGRFEADQHQNGDSEEASDTSNHSESESFSEKSSVIRSII